MVNFQAELEFKPGVDNDDHPAPSKTGKDLGRSNTWKGRKNCEEVQI